jgi:DNA invertase Pin-like site-specific DNA recombinase
MYAEAQRGNINVIIIKDTSRFGRNWVKSGVYFESIEEMGVRFISIQESIDTADPQCPALKMLPLYFIFNEWHSSTTSEKIRTVLNKQAEQGKYRGSKVLFGYDKSPDDKYKLVIDPPAANVVKRIFEMRLQKFSYGAIARVLNSEGLPSPSEYHALRFGKVNKRSHDGNWSSDAVDRVLCNPAYCGDIARNRSGTKSFKNRKAFRKPKEEWIVTENVHEPSATHNFHVPCFSSIIAGILDLVKMLNRF